jgi:hypothetical protein
MVWRLRNPRTGVAPVELGSTLPGLIRLCAGVGLVGIAVLAVALLNLAGVRDAGPLAIASELMIALVALVYAYFCARAARTWSRIDQVLGTEARSQTVGVGRLTTSDSMFRLLPHTIVLTLTDTALVGVDAVLLGRPKQLFSVDIVEISTILSPRLGRLVVEAGERQWTVDGLPPSAVDAVLSATRLRP